MSTAAACRDQRRQRRRGFGLIEVMISASMLVLGLAGILSFAAQTSVTSAHQRHITIAAHLADMQLEKLLLLAPDHARLTVGPHSGLVYNDIGVADVAGRFSASWDVVTGAPLVNTRTIVVTVSWTDATGVRTTTLKTVRT